MDPLIEYILLALVVVGAGYSGYGIGWAKGVRLGTAKVIDHLVYHGEYDPVNKLTICKIEDES
jgi:hypothetical protein